MAPMQMSDDACRVCGKEDDEEFLVLCDGCDRAFHTSCAQGCTCCNTKPRNNFARKPAVPRATGSASSAPAACPSSVRPLLLRVSSPVAPLKLRDGRLTVCTCCARAEEGKKPVSSVFAWGTTRMGRCVVVLVLKAKDGYISVESGGIGVAMGVKLTLRWMVLSVAGASGYRGEGDLEAEQGARAGWHRRAGHCLQRDVHVRALQ